MQVLFLFTVLAAFAASAAAAPNREQRDLAARASPYKVTLLLGPGVKGMETTGAIQTGTWTLEAPSGGNDYIPLEFKIGAKEKRLSCFVKGIATGPAQFQLNDAPIACLNGLCPMPGATSQAGVSFGCANFEAVMNAPSS